MLRNVKYFNAACLHRCCSYLFLLMIWWGSWIDCTFRKDCIKSLVRSSEFTRYKGENLTRSCRFSKCIFDHDSNQKSCYYSSLELMSRRSAAAAAAFRRAVLSVSDKAMLAFADFSF
uniref:Uncharacterized protein n=1 Tax=Ditylum brightwellii TaxID=49249 RepID=A0A7S4RSB5_9STRA